MPSDGLAIFVTYAEIEFLFLCIYMLKYNYLFCCYRAKSYMRDGKYENVVAECTAEIDSGGEHSDSAR
jgi:hypothetical protein